MAGVFQSSSLLLKIGFILIAIAIIVYGYGFLEPHWMIIKSPIDELRNITIGSENITVVDKITVQTGLWKWCSYKYDFAYESRGKCSVWQNVPSWLAGVRAALTIGAIILIVSTGAVIIQLFFKKCKQVQIVGVVGSAAAGITIGIGIAIYVAEIPKEYEFKYCFWLCAFAALVSLISTPFLLADLKRQPTTPTTDQPVVLYPNCPTQSGEPTKPGDMKSIQYAKAPMQ